MILTIVAFVLILVALIIAHELGHFITAKACGVKVEEFGLGFPPRIYGFKRGETIYSLNWLPFGAFVKLLGEEDPGNPRSLAAKNRGIRFLVLSAGSLMNLLIPILLFATALMIPHDTIREDIFIKEVAPGSPAQSAGIVPGDQLVRIDGRAVTSRLDVSYQIRLNLGHPVSVVLKATDGMEKLVTVTPRWKPPAGQGAAGIVIQPQNTQRVTESQPFWEAIPNGAIRAWEMLVLFRNEVFLWITGGSTPQVTGPIGIVQMTGEVAQAGISPLFEFTALISINLGILNLFPIPGLDGGRLIFVVLEWLRRGKRVSPQREGLIHFIGFVTLIILITIVSYFDIMRVIQGGSLLP
ncbi:MAG: M50 family metallopeptidase [Chloroflexota bacterium]